MSFLDSFPRRTRSRIGAVYVLLIGMNVGAWLWALAAFRHHPLLLGTALLAYTFGLRHAVDADHIAAIDNATRKLMQQGKRPAAVGFFFALGHSTIVILATLAVIFTAGRLGRSFDLAAWHATGALVGTTVSALFLLAIAVVNLVLLVNLVRTYRRVHRTPPTAATDDFTGLDPLLDGGGLFARLLRPLFALIGESWHLYPLGFLFGLGFDTATEVGLLGISATQAAHHLPLGSLFVFPLLFTSGMALIDMTDGVLMTGAYGWALEQPVRRLRYNMAVTAVSIAAALVIGGIEGLGLLGEKLNFAGTFWNLIGAANDHLGGLGLGLVGLFALLFLGSYVRQKGVGRPFGAG